MFSSANFISPIFRTIWSVIFRSVKLQVYHFPRPRFYIVSAYLTIYTVFQKRSTFLFQCSFYNYRLIFVAFGTQYTEVSCNTAVIHLPISPAYCGYITLENFELHNNDFVSKC